MISLYKIIAILCFICLAYQNSYAQTVTISGILKDEYGDTLPGAAILILGSERGTTTDIDGKYTFTAQVGDKVRISFVGYEDKEYVVTAQGLKSSKQVGEIVNWPSWRCGAAQ